MDFIIMHSKLRVSCSAQRLNETDNSAKPHPCPGCDKRIIMDSWYFVHAAGVCYEVHCTWGRYTAPWIQASSKVELAVDPGSSIAVHLVLERLDPGLLRPGQQERHQVHCASQQDLEGRSG